MKKLITLKRVAMTLLFTLMYSAQALAGATWVGNSAINVNGTWYYCGNSSMSSWCSGGAFNGATIGSIMSLAIGGQSQVAANGENWNSGTLVMHYKIDGGSWNDHNLSYESYGYGEYSNNMRFQSGGSTFTTQVIDISGLSAGDHTLSIYFGPLDNQYDGNSSSSYVATFKIPATQTITIPASGKGTYSSAFNLDFSSTSTVSAYTVSALSSTSATLTKLTQKVPAGTGLIVMGCGSEDISVVNSSDPIGTNYLHATGTSGTTVVADYAYILSSGQFHPANAGTIPANKAYLLAANIPASPASQSRSLNLVYEETTGINATQISNDLLSGDYYNLAGQRVTKPSKGLYIVNGKKVIIK